MATTANLKLVKPVSEQDAQKIATLNVESDDLDAAIAGIIVKSVAGSANVTLTRAEALTKVLKFTGVLTGNITVYLPVVANAALSPVTTTIGSARSLIVWNATTGAFTLTLKTSAVGSTGVAITQGTKAIAAHDGTNVFADATTGGAVMTSGDYGAADGSLPAGVEATFYRNTNASSKRLFLYNAAAFRAVFQAGIDLVNLASNVTGTLPIANGGTANTTLAYTTLTDGATITWPVAGIVNNAVVTLGGNRTLAFSGLVAGMSGTLIVKQDATGSRTLTLPAASKVINGGAGAITLTTTASAIDILAWTYDGTNTFWSFGKNYS